MPLFVTVTPGTTITSSTTLSASTLNLLGTPSIDITGSVDGGTLSVADGSLGLSKFSPITGNRLIGNGSAVSAYPAELSSTDLTFTASTVNVAAGAIDSTKLGARAVTAAKLFAVDGTTTAKLIGRYTTGSGDVETLTVGSNLTVSGGALTTLRPRTTFLNLEAPFTYILTADRANAVILTDLNTSITPQTNTSKILLQFHLSYETNSLETAFILERVDGATVTPLGVPSTPGNRIYGTKVAAYDSDNNRTQSTTVIAFLDSPASTNAITYRLRAYSSSSSTLVINGTIGTTNSSQFTRATSQVILQEILPT